MFRRRQSHERWRKKPPWKAPQFVDRQVDTHDPSTKPRNKMENSMNFNHFRNTRAAARTKQTRRFTLGALGVAILALALIITGMLTTDSADAQMTNTTTIWSATMTVGLLSQLQGSVTLDHTGFSENHGSLSSTQFTYDGTSYSIDSLRTEKTTLSGVVQSNSLELRPSPLFPTTADSKLVLELDGTEFALADATRQTNAYFWSSHSLSWAENQSVTVKLTTSDPGVSSIALTSDPNDDSRTGNDDTLRHRRRHRGNPHIQPGRRCHGQPADNADHRLQRESRKLRRSHEHDNRCLLLRQWPRATTRRMASASRPTALRSTAAPYARKAATPTMPFSATTEVAVNSHRTRSMASGPPSSPPAPMHREFL